MHRSINDSIDAMPKFIWKLFFYTSVVWIFTLLKVIFIGKSYLPVLAIESIFLFLTLYRSKVSWIILFSFVILTIIAGSFTIIRTMYGTDMDALAFPLMAVVWAIYVFISLLKKESRVYYGVTVEPPGEMDYSDEYAKQVSEDHQMGIKG